MISCFIIFMHQIGQDSKNIVLIQFNPILLVLERNILDLMNKGYQIPSGNLSGTISIYWYIGSVVTFAFYGGVIDMIRYVIKSNRYIKNQN